MKITIYNIIDVMHLERRKLREQAKIPSDYYFLWGNNNYKCFKRFLKTFGHCKDGFPLFLGMYHKVGVDIDGYRVLSVADNPEVKKEIRAARYKYYEQK